jgi:signal transduction histidine kinase
MAAMQTADRKAETGHPAVGARALATVVGAAVIVGVASFATASAHTDPASRTHVLVTLAVTGIALLVSGVLCWAMRPASRIGPMLCVTALLWWLPYLQQAEIDLVATCGYLARDLWLASLVHIVVTYPDGRSAGWTRVIVVLVYLRVLVPNLATALLAPAPPPLQNLNFFNVATEPALVTDIHGVATQYMGWVVSVAVLAVFVLRLIRGTRVSRMTMLPLSLAALLTLVYFTLSNFSCGTIFGWQEGGDTIAYTAIPLAILLALTGGRRARGRMGSLLTEIGGQPDSGALHHALARALRDPTLELAYRIGPAEGWVTPEGYPFELPLDDPRRMISYVERDGEPVAAIVHDAALENEPERLEPVRRAVRLLADNERLTAQVRHQLAEVRASRRRILEAGDQARRGVERNLHDGAQQRLVGLALNLRLAQRAADPTTALQLDEFAQELEAAIAELRELARGIHPSVVSESGLTTALAALAKRSPMPVSVEIDLPGRYADTIEATVYYVVSEALTNVARYASASAASLTVFEAGDLLHVEVRDDGVGGAQIDAGSGLSGLRDRVEAIGGALIVESPPGTGTRVVVQIELSGRVRPTEQEAPRDAGFEPIS